MSWLDLSAYYIMAGTASDRLEALAGPAKNDSPRRIDHVIDYFGGDGPTSTAALTRRRGRGTVSPRAVAARARAHGGHRWRESRAATKAAENTKTTAE
jgi:hypothetical protein